MRRKKENKRNIIIIIVLAILLIISLFFVFIFGKYYYENINKPQYGLGIPNVGGNSCSVDEHEKVNIAYIMDKKKLIEFDKYENEFLDRERGIKYIEYPVIIGEHKSVLDLNDRIKEKVDFYINEFESFGEVIDKDTSLDELCYVEVLSDKTQKNYCNYYTLEYDLYINDKYISIVEDRLFISERATGFNELNEIYIVDKSSGMVVSNDDVIKNINNLSLMKNNLVKYIKENYENLEYYKFSEISKEDFLADLDILLSTNSFKVFFDENSIYFYFNKIQGVNNVVFKYSDTWEEVWEMYNF